ncbi:MAG: uridine kinase [Eubacteriaceae bacterium]|nr:uridine kinase [Eubacteriaceae bacterium]
MDKNSLAMQAIVPKIIELQNQKEIVLAAIDGRCASGKSALAAVLEKELLCNVLHMDDFFLRPGQRTKERLAEPGGNVDRERFEIEVLLPLSKGLDFSYRPFRCDTMGFGNPVKVEAKPIAVIEGSYSHHPALAGYYDLRIFLSIDYESQLARIEKRGGQDALKSFASLWIPMEEAYFEAFNVEKAAHFCFGKEYLGGK